MINSDRPLTNNEQYGLRARLKPLIKLEGVIEMHLEPDTLYVEFNPNLFNLEIFKLAISDSGFPIEQDIKLASFHYSV